MSKEFKRKEERNNKGRSAGKSGNERSSGPQRGDKKKSDKPVFKRYREESRPSDFGSSKGSASSRPSFPKRKSDTPFNKEKKFSDKPFGKEGRSGDKPFNKDKRSGDKPFSKEKKSENKPFRKEKRFGDKPSFRKKEVNSFDLDESDFEYGQKSERNEKKSAYERKPYVKKSKSARSGSPHEKNEDGTVRLNKYIANAGICSRREADDLIASGVVQVNGKVITEMGYKVKPTDVIRYGGQTLKKEKLVYLILNKPKDYITTADDPQKRRTVLELIQGACRERIYPVGRLDRATTGLLMFTNDGELTKKLTHPRYGVRKIYHVELDKPLKREDMEKISSGLELEDGDIKVDEITYVGDGRDKTQVGVELHSGKNRIVRRIFEHMGYNVRKLDRVMFGSLTKKDLPRGRWRMLTESEVGILKMISTGKD